MPTPTFTGKIPFVPPGFNNTNIGVGNVLIPRDLPYLTSPIIWDNPTKLPRQLNVTLDQILKNQGPYTTTTTMLIEVAGYTENLFWQSYVPQVRFYFQVPGRGTVEKIYSTEDPGWSLTPRTFRFPGKSIPGTSLSGVISNVTDLGVPTSVGIYFASAGDRVANEWRGVFVRFTLNISVRVNCTGSHLDSVICSEYCQDNLQECYTDERAYCFPGNIGSSEPCQNYVQNYIQNVRTDPGLDSDLTTYCKKYAGFGDLFKSNNQADIDLCACHMPQDQYDNFANQLFDLYPGFANLGLNKRCLIPQCADSPYKTVGTTKQCLVPKCINFASFTNNGTFDQSKITINQNAPGCANIVGPTPGPGPGPGPGPTPGPGPGPRPGPGPGPGPGPTPAPSGTNWALIIGIILGVVVLIIIIIVVVLLARPKASPPSPVPPNGEGALLISTE
uniref:Uncharacterized protein n=1 Tax=viral metagenome TaxID=1070528 RepID=A0A6C0IZF2_9ZZZZ